MGVEASVLLVACIILGSPITLLFFSASQLKSPSLETRRLRPCQFLDSGPGPVPGSTRVRQYCRSSCAESYLDVPSCSFL
jgi:hypothetical protein